MNESKATGKQGQGAQQRTTAALKNQEKCVSASRFEK
jgi:hypothetical protein